MTVEGTGAPEQGPPPKPARAQPLTDKMSGLFRRVGTGAAEGEGHGTPPIAKEAHAIAAGPQDSVISRIFRKINDKLTPVLPEDIASKLDPRLSIINSILEVPAEERADVLRHAFLIVSPWADSALTENFIKNVTACANDGGNLLSKILPLITPDVFSFPSSAASADAVANTIQSVARIKAEERDDVLIHAGRLFALVDRATVPSFSLPKGFFPGASFVRQMREVPPQERDNFVAQASQLFTFASQNRRYPLQSGTFLMEDIIDTLLDIPVGQRDELIAQAVQFIPQGMKFCSPIIIKALYGIPFRERGDVLAHARQFFTPEKYRLLAAIMKALGQIPHGERDEFVTQTLQLITQNIDVFLGGKIIEVLRQIPFWARADFVPRALRHLEDPRREDFLFIHWMERKAEEYQRADQNQRYGPQRVQHGINVHEGDRDQRTKEALGLLRDVQRTLSPSEIDQAYGKFVEYLHTSADSKRKSSAQHALLTEKRGGEEFGPLIDNEVIFTIQGVELSGKELIGRLWIFASGLPEKEQENAKESMISALANSYDDYGRVCNQGKTQRLLIAVLQGRLAGVNIDSVRVKVSEAEAMQMFFGVEAHRLIENLEDLIAAANKFCDENASVDREKFLEEINKYAKQQGIEQTSPDNRPA